jgi:hypothetical protein
MHTNECTDKKSASDDSCAVRVMTKRNKQDHLLCPVTEEPSRSQLTYMATYALVKADIWSGGLMRGEEKPTLPADRTLYRACRSLYLWLSHSRLV